MFAPEIFELLLLINKPVRAEIPLVLEQLGGKPTGEKVLTAFACSLWHSVEGHKLQLNSAYTAVGVHKNVKTTSLSKKTHSKIQTRINKSRKALCTLTEELSHAIISLASS